MDRQQRRDLKRDRFVDEIGTLSSRARENQRLLLTVTVAVLAAALIGYGIYFYRSDREKKGQEALASAIETMNSPLIPPTGDVPPGAKYKTDEEKNAAAEVQFRKVLNTYGGTDAADVAGLYIASFDTTKGNFPEARKLLEKFVNEKPDHLLWGAARYSLYQLRIESGESQQVVNELNQEIARTDPVLPTDTLLALLAHAYDAQGKDDQTRQAYRRIVTEFPDSPYALEAQRRIGPA
jgi:tetratricopeptide (TPR) repeat protein